MSDVSLAFLSELALERASSALGETTSAAPVPRSDVNYESLMAGSSQPVLIAEPESGRITLANPAASRLLRIPGSTLIGAPLDTLFDASSVASLNEAAASPIEVRVAHREDHLRARASQVRANGRLFLLIRLHPMDNATLTHLNGHATSSVVEAMDHAGVALVVTDEALRIQFANRSFEQIAGIATEEAGGQSMTRWLQLAAADIGRLRDQRIERRATILIEAIFQPAHAASRKVEVEAIAVPEGTALLWGFIVRELPLSH